MAKKLSLIHLVIVALFAAGCSGIPGKKETADLDREIKQKSDEMKSDMSQSEPVQTHEGASFLGNSRIKLKEKRNLPNVFQKKVMLADGPMPLPKAVSKISSMTGVSIQLSPRLRYSKKRQGTGKNERERVYTHQITKSTKMPMQYEGSLKGLLDIVASYYGAFWEWKQGKVYIYRLKTKTYDLITSPGEIEMENKLSNEAKGGGESNSGGSGNGGSREVESFQKAKFNYVFNIWEKTVSNVKSMLSDSGKVVVNPSSGTVTVTDTPQIHGEVKTYVDQINSRLSRQVAISAKIYSFDLNDSGSYGANIRAVFEDMNEQLSAEISGASPLELLSGSGLLSAALLDKDAGNRNYDSTTHQWGGSEAVVRALDKMGNVKLVTSGSGIAMNNQPLPIQVVKRQGYLAESTTSQTAESTSTTLQSGTITTGFSLSATPHILQNNEVVLQYNISLSDLQDMKVIESGDSKIQTPETSSRNFMQQVRMKTGETLFLGGFARKNDNYDSGRGLLGFQEKGTSQRKIILVAITVNEVS